jgi:hypothetical protein
MFDIIIYFIGVSAGVAFGWFIGFWMGTYRPENKKEGGMTSELEEPWFPIILWSLIWGIGTMVGFVSLRVSVVTLFVMPFVCEFRDLIISALSERKAGR